MERSDFHSYSELQSYFFSRVFCIIQDLPRKAIGELTLWSPDCTC